MIIWKYLIVYIKLWIIGHLRITNTDYFVNNKIHHTPQKEVKQAQKYFHAIRIF